MTEAEAEARLRAMTSASDEPALTASEVAMALDKSRLVDAAGRTPSNANWVPTWDLNRGAAFGWSVKAGRVAARFDFQADGARYDRSQIYQHCIGMVERYKNAVMGTVVMPGSLEVG